LASHPVQYHTPLYRALASDPDVASDVLYLSMPDAQSQGVGFGQSLTWDLPLLDGYRWHQARSGRGRGIIGGYAGVWLADPLGEMGWGPSRERPDAILLTGWHYLGLLQAFWAAKFLRIPVILRMESNEARPRSWLAHQMHRMLFRGLSMGLPIGKSNARWYLNNGLKNDQLIKAPYFIDNARFAGQVAQQQSERPALRQHWNIPEEAFCFLFAGKLQSKKRPQDLIEALALLLKEKPKGLPAVHLLIVGNGHLKEACEKQVHRSGLPVSFAGFLNQTEITRAYVACDCFVLPSDHGETWGLVVNEAMACGLPAVVSDQVGCHEDLIIEGVTGLSYPCGDTLALSACLRKMASDPQSSRGMGEAARVRVNTMFTIETAAAAVKTAVMRLKSKGDQSKL
jgi:glycosyltransferase involved in cell wall biosynthesis